MNKDVIYIDVDDDVTAVIGKIKSAKEKIVALVPPKRAGALQSAVNLRLIDRMAKAEKKHLVLITNNQALISLAASAMIPVAKNLQSKPEIADIPALAVDEGDDIIDGGDLPVGDHAATVPVTDNTREQGRSDAIDDIDVDKDSSAAPLIIGAAAGAKAAKAKGKGRIKVPNFDTFRKKLFLGIGAGVLLIALLVWMFVFAPAATVIITARTSPAPISSTVTLTTDKATNFEEGLLKSVVQKEEKDETIEITATGQKDLGEKATGTVRFSTTDAATAIGGATIPKGTVLTSSSGASFSTDSAAVISASNFSDVQVTVTATEGGESSNGASGALSGAPSKISANLIGSTAGGTSRVVKVVSAEDVERARGDLIGKSTDETKAALIAKFTDGEKIIDSSFKIDRGTVSSSPAVDQEAADGKATLTIPTTYSITAIPKAELEQYLDASLKEQLLDEKTQRIYDKGIESAALSNYRTQNKITTASLTATGQVGPLIEENEIKEQVKGKRYGDVQSSLQSIEGVQDVDVKFSFFWVNTVPGNPDKIEIEFKLENE